MVIRVLRDHRVCIFGAISVEEPDISPLPDFAGIERRHPGVAQEARAEVAAALNVDEYREALAVKLPAVVGDAISETADLEVTCRVNGTPRNSSGVARAGQRAGHSDAQYVVGQEWSAGGGGCECNLVGVPI